MAASGGCGVPDWRHEHLTKCHSGGSSCESVDMSTAYNPGDILHNDARFWFIVGLDFANEDEQVVVYTSLLSAEGLTYRGESDQLMVFGHKWRVWRAAR